MSNIRVTYDTDLNNARSESSLVINPNNTQQIVAGSKKFINYHTYDFTLATAYSADGGQTWADSAALDINITGWYGISDPALAWDDAGNVFLVALPLKEPPPHPNSLAVGIAVYKSTDGGQTWGQPKLIHTGDSDDKQWAAGDGNPGSPFHGRVYAAWDGPGGLCFARTLDHGNTWIGTGTSPAGTAIAPSSFSPEVNVAADGTVYIVFMNQIGGNEINMVKSTDGGNSFQATASPATGIGSITTNTTLPGGNFRIATVPTACDFGPNIVVAWADNREGNTRTYYAVSPNGGASWNTPLSGQPLLAGLPVDANMFHFHPQIVFRPNGVLGCAFYEFGPKPLVSKIDTRMALSFDNGISFSQLFTVTDQPWDPTVDAPWAHGDQNLTFIGDYFGFDASDNGFYPLWTDTRTGIQELWMDIMPRKTCAIILERNPIGQDEILARRKKPYNSSGGLPIQDAIRVVVDGFRASELALTNSSQTLITPPAFNPPVAGMTIIPAGNTSDNGDYGPELQRFTFFYNLDFPDSTDPEFSFSGASKDLTLDVTVGGLSASALLTLIKQPDPFLLHGDPAWLSIDLRIFVVRPHETWFGVKMGADASAAPKFIQKVMKALTDGKGTAGGQSFDDPNVLSPDEDHSKLYQQPNDEHGTPVFNFALAKVHYIGLIGATAVRVFFRLRQTQVTYAPFDYTPGGLQGQYRHATSNPEGQPIALAGIEDGEYVTVPCFSRSRVDSTAVGMDQQTDSAIDASGYGNIRDFTANADGSEVDHYFGCWIDINQCDPRLPFDVPPYPYQDGPFKDPMFPPLPLKQALSRNLHLCVIAEIDFDLTPIPLGKDPSNWDKLAQRNIVWSDSGSAQAVTTFEIRPTPMGLPADQTPDELMIDWGNTPKGSVASIYLPAVKVDHILAMANRMYATHRLARADDHTLQCKTGGITYVPVPSSTNASYAGLLSVDLPDHLRRGEVYTVIVRQVTNAFGKATPPPPPPPKIAARRKTSAAAVVAPAEIEWRRVLGAFQLTIPVKTKRELLLREERDLSVLRWIAEAIPHHSRWYPVFRRYLDQIAGRVKVFGGDPSQILPSPTGEGIPKRRRPEEEEREERIGFTGKIAGLIFDRFGDFEGFILDTEDGERKLFSREKEIEELAERAWRERLRITVCVEHHSPHLAECIIIRQPPAPFHA